MKIVSAKEHRIVLLITALCFAFWVIRGCWSIIYNNPNKGESFGLYDIFQMTELMVPFYTFFLLPLIFILIWKLSKLRLIFSFIFTAMLSKAYLTWIIETREAISLLEGTEYIIAECFLFRGSYGDLVCCICIFGLLLWQLSIVFRFAISHFHAKIYLR